MLEKDYPSCYNRSKNMKDLQYLIEDKNVVAVVIDGKYIGEIVFFDDEDGLAMRISDLGGSNTFVETRNKFVSLEWYVSAKGVFITLELVWLDSSSLSDTPEISRKQIITLQPLVFTAFKD